MLTSVTYIRISSPELTARTLLKDIEVKLV